MTAKPKLSFWQIWNMSFGFLGIQFGFALQNGNTSRIFQSLGAEGENLAFYWLAAPVTGLLVQPIIGYYSDRTWHPRWGRRRPYFAIGAILAAVALFIMPNSATLWMAIGTLWIMDASINISMEPFRAFVGDLLPLSQRTRGFAMQSFFIGVGAVVASALPWIMTNWFDISNIPAPGEDISPSVKWSFYLGGIVFISAVFWTVFTTKEYPPEKENPDEDKSVPLRIRYKPSFYSTIGIILILISFILGFWFYSNNMEKELYVLCGISGLFGLVYFIAARFMAKNIYRIGFVQIVRDFQNMPKTMIQLAFVQFFSWFALFAMWIYTTPGVTSHIYDSVDTTSKAYNDGADWVNILFSAYNGIAALAALIIPYVSKRIGRRLTHLIALACGGLGLISTYYIDNPDLLIISMIGVGIAWASILSIPYAMLSSTIPQEKMGYYMGIFNFFIVIPQIIAASILGFILKHAFGSEPIYALIIGGISMILSGLLCLLVNDRDELTVADP